MELGAGGTVRKFVECGVEVKSIVFSPCKKSVPKGLPKDTLIKECHEAAEHLGIKDRTILDYEVREFHKYREEIRHTLYLTRKDFEPDLVVTSWHRDMHQDHQTLGEESKGAFMRSGISIWEYQVPGTCRGFDPQTFVVLSEDDVQKKIEMLQKYKSQVNYPRDYFSPDKIKAFLKHMGTFIRMEYAEGFVQDKAIFTEFNSP